MNVVVVTEQSGPHHDLLVGFSDVSVIGPGGLSISVPDLLGCAVVFLQELFGLHLICYFA